MDHEIELAPRADQLPLPPASPVTYTPHGDDSASDIAKVQDIDKESMKSALEDEGDDGEAPIVYHYLTFETELPHPTSIYPPYPNAPPPPEPPNLKKYGNPFDWPEKFKTTIMWICCAATSITAFTAGSYTGGLGQMTAYFNVSDVSCLTGITIFTCGFGIAPMVLAPFSEINGRRPVFLVTGALFVISQLFCAVTRSFPGFLLARFACGVGGSTFSTMVGGVVSDIYHTKDRNTPMALFSGAALFGTGFGPVICGLVAQHFSWRWIFYLQVIMDGVVIVIFALILKEPRGSVLLSRKAKDLNRWYEAREKAGYYGFDMPVSTPDPPNNHNPVIEKQTHIDSPLITQRIRWKVQSSESRLSLSRMISISLYRPFHLLLTEPVVFFFTLWVSFSWAVLYLTLAAVPLVFSDVYDFNIEQRGAVFTSTCVAAVVATLMSVYQEKLAWKYGKVFKNTPEDRLYFACVESALLPVGLFLFGWTAAPSIHWIVPTIGIGIAIIGIFSIYLAVFNYLADTYHRYASSALAAQSFGRNMLGGAFPLITTQMYKRLGYGGASSFLGGVAVLLTIVPWVLVFFGPRIRARSKFASEIMR